jgi:hypothetical protein
MFTFTKSINISWLVVHVTLVTWEAETRRITVPGQPGQKISKTPSQPLTDCSGVCLSFQAMWEAEIKRPAVPGQSGQNKQTNKQKTPNVVISHLNRKKLGVVVYACHLRDGRKPKNGRTEVQDSLGKQRDPSSKMTRE